MTRARFVAPDGYAIERARASDVALLPEIEREASAVFPAEDIPGEVEGDFYEEDELAEAFEANRLWVARESATGLPVGFALTSRVDGTEHLLELDVLPAHGGRGLGRALVDAVGADARERGSPTLTLTTFAHLPWNAPFYERIGFERVPRAECAPELGSLLDREAALGFDPAKRIAMCLDLSIMRD